MGQSDSDLIRNEIHLIEMKILHRKDDVIDFRTVQVTPVRRDRLTLRTESHNMMEVEETIHVSNCLEDESVRSILE